jgi:hypothetical protein
VSEEIKQTSVAPADPQRVVLAQRGSLSSTAVRTMRSRGIEVVFVKDPTSLKEFGNDRFQFVSNLAKVQAFEYALKQGAHNFTKHELNSWYIHFLKESGAF